jgi:transcriptional regulator with XRE-family HTH domain
MTILGSAAVFYKTVAADPDDLPQRSEKSGQLRRVASTAPLGSLGVGSATHRLAFMNRGWSESLSLGEMIRRQREIAALPMRQLAAMAGISNPYLSQIERGLRDPSDQVLNAIADSLQMSADSLRPPTPEPDPDAAPPAVVAAVRADPDLTAQQRKALEESYLAFREVTIERRRLKGRRNGAASSDVSPANAD